MAPRIRGVYDFGHGFVLSSRDVNWIASGHFVHISIALGHGLPPWGLVSITIGFRCHDDEMAKVSLSGTRCKVWKDSMYLNLFKKKRRGATLKNQGETPNGPFRGKICRTAEFEFQEH